LLGYLARHGLDSPSGLAGISRAQLDAMLELAVRAAALTCSRVGPDLPYWHELDAR
jgi:fructokinase